jgi:hypothetical protein
MRLRVTLVFLGLVTAVAACGSVHAPVESQHPASSAVAVKPAPPQASTPRAAAAPAPLPSGPTIGVRPQGLFYDDVALCPQGTVCKTNPYSVLVLPLIGQVRQWRDHAPLSSLLTVLVDPSLGYAALADVVGSLSNVGERSFLLGSTSRTRWNVILRGADAQGPNFHLRGGGAFDVSRDTSPLDSNCDQAAPQPVPMTLDADLSRCIAGLPRGPTHGTINFYVRREATIGELLRILDALGNDTTVALSIAL